MALIADSGALYALYDADDRHHEAVLRSVKRERGPIILPVAILGELDYLIRRFLGIDAEIDLLDAIVSGGYVLENLSAADLGRCRELIAAYRELDLGLADAAVIAVAERLCVRTILTVDERDFRAVRPRGGQPFQLLPADGG